MYAEKDMGFRNNNINNFGTLNNSPNFFGFNNVSNFNNSFINNNFNQMPNMMQNNMNMNNFNNFNMMMNPMNNFNQFFPMNYNNNFIQNPSQYMSYNMYNNMNFFLNNINNTNNMPCIMNDIKFNCNNSMNNYNNINNKNIKSIQPMYNGNNSMNNIQPNFFMNEMNKNVNYNQNPMNNMINSVNINNYNHMNKMNNYYNNNIYNNTNSLSNSYNNISFSLNSDDFSLGQSINEGLSNTYIPMANELNITFAFTTSETFDVSGKPNDKLSSLINKFKNKQCPDKLKDHLNLCLHFGYKLDIEKTLRELGIKNGARILFVVKQINNDNDNDDKKEKKNSHNNDLAQLSPSGIIIKEHIHNLVYCLNNFSWKCNLCKGKYEKKSPKYYCSICNFSLCEKCHAIRNYPKKKVFSDEIDDSNISIEKKFLKTVYHKHYLVYSRTSRDSDELKQWYCNNCQETFENNIWSFYCTKCDYDLCKKCAGYN